MRELAERHPNLITWLVLAVGMLLVLAWSAREVVLSASQWFWLAAATVLLAGLCAWIISWEADEPDEAGATTDTVSHAKADATTGTDTPDADSADPPDADSADAPDADSADPPDADSTDTPDTDRADTPDTDRADEPTVETADDDMEPPGADD